MAQAMSSMASLRGVSQPALLESGHMMSSTRLMPTTAPSRLAPAGINKAGVLSIRAAASEDSSASLSSSSSAQSTRRSILGLFAAGVTVGAVAQKALADARSIKVDGPPPPSGGKPGTLLSDEARDLDLPLKERFYIQPLTVEQAAARAKESAKQILEVKKLIEKKAWPYVQNDLRSKASYLRYDLNTVEQLKQVSTLVLTKDDVDAVDSNCSSRKGSMLISDHMPTSALASSKHEQNNEKGYDSLQNIQSSNYDSVSNESSIPLRNMLCPTPESVPSESNSEPDNPELTLRKITNSTMDSLSNQLKLEGENCICDSRKSSISTFDSVSCQIEPLNENSMHLRGVSDSTLDSISEKLSMETRDDSISTMSSLDQSKDEAENLYCNLSKVSNTTKDSVLGQHGVEAENSQSNFSIVSNTVTNSVLGQTEDNIESPKTLNVAFGSISDQVEAEKSTHSFRELLTSDMDSVSNQPKVEAEISVCTLSSAVDSVSVQPGNALNTNLDSPSDQLQPQVEAENGNCKLEKGLNVAFDSMPIQVEAEKSTGSFRKTLTLGMDSVSNQPEVEVENNNCTLSSVVDSVSAHPGNASSSNFDSASVQLQPRVEAENGDCSLDKLSNTAFDSVPSVQGTSPIHQSTRSSPESNKPENAPAQKGISGDSIPTKHKQLESPVKSSFESPSISRRRSSFGSRKAGHSENDSQGSPSLPNYMAATVSAKAKSRAVNSQELSPDVQEYSTGRRRNSFPASNGNQHTGSPHIQRSSPQVQRATKGNGVHSPRDSTEKLKQTEWRR